ncbi:hypothetical protein AX17_005600 [Amanita inopinata Kibby_2008]|nr:hypothetical protein AX17_005600 [Amanita inopinata Kibby_2008]
MATKKLAESTLYHLSPKGFWKKFREVASANPSVSSGLPVPGINRYPQPGSRPEKYSTPATKASDPAQNPYWKRDVRRAYPQLSMITQCELSALLTEHSGTHTAIPSPTEQDSISTPLVLKEAPELTEAIASMTQKTKVYTMSTLPPTLPITHGRWIPQLASAAPHEPHSYFPMSLYR